MNTSELAKEVATVAGIPVARAENIIRYTFAKIVEAVAKGDTVKLYNFGYFSFNQHNERKGHNPQSGEAITIKAQKVAHWSVSIAIKEVLNGTRDIKSLFEGIDPKIDQPRGPAPKLEEPDPNAAAAPAAAAPVSAETKKGKKAAPSAPPAPPSAPAAPAAPAGTVPPPPPVV